MKLAFELLGILAVLGAVDVLYFHIYRFRLFEQPASVAEEVTHLVRAAVFIAITALIVFSDGSRTALVALLALAALDLLNNGVDVLLERRSRAPLGGLPSVEYLLHILATFLTGAAVMAVWAASTSSGFEPLAPTLVHQVRGGFAIGAGILMLVVESALFARALCARHCVMAPA